MTNTLTALLPTLFKTVSLVMREQVGFIPAVSRDFTPEQMNLAVGQTMTIPLSVSQTLGDYTPGMTTTAGTDKTPTSATLTIARNRSSSFHLTHEEEQLLTNGGTLPGYREQQIAECFRVFCNEIETDIGTAMDLKFSRAYGTAATTPFASSLADVGGCRKILIDNGAWAPGLMEMVLDSAAENNLGNLTQLTNVNQAGTDSMLRQGVLTSLRGFNIRVSAGVASHAAGTNSGGTTDNAGYAIGATTLTLASAGSGTILQGDAIAITGDGSAQKYGIKTGDADVSGGGTAVLYGPGLRGALSAATHALTTSATHTSNMAFRRDSVLLYARPPLIKRTAVIDTVVVTDPFSGMSFLVCEIVGDGMTTYRVNLAWGVSVIKENAVVKLLG